MHPLVFKSEIIRNVIGLEGLILVPVLHDVVNHGRWFGKH